MHVNGHNYQEPGESLELLVNGENIVFKYIPAGKFQMGSPISEEGRRSNETQHWVILTKSFFMQETHVTQALWKAVSRELPHALEGAENFLNDQYPMVEVTWDDCFRFISKLNDQNIAPEGLIFDLPTEAEWEYACRAGTTTPYYCGMFIGPADAYFGLGGYSLKEVKTYQPNPWGLYDMYGNAWEWCSDWFADYIFDTTTGSVTDPKGPERSGPTVDRVTRGGGSHATPDRVRSAKRYHSYQNSHECDLGFRLVLREREK